MQFMDPFYRGCFVCSSVFVFSWLVRGAGARLVRGPDRAANQGANLPTYH
jgi:hypothetical protein